MKRILTTLFSVATLATTAMAQTGAIINPSTGFVAKGTNTVVEFQVTQYNAALDADVSKTICGATVAVSGEGATAGAVSYVPQAIGNKGTFLLTVPSSAVLGGTVNVTISGITIKNGANACGVSPISVPDIAASFTVAVDALPVELTSFVGRANQNSVLLKWTTASEENNASFVIERSFNASKFERVGEVRGAGNANSERNYTFTTPLNKPMAYYRLGATDLNGVTTYAKTITVFNTTNGLRGGVLAQPSGLQLQLNAEESGEAIVNVTDLAGRTILSQNVELTEGVNDQFIGFDAPMGIYIVTINNGKDVVTAKLMKNR